MMKREERKRKRERERDTRNVRDRGI